jgi:hypothetical protein
MLGTVFDMDHFDFLRRFLRHITAASSALWIVLMIGEYMVPGVVLPFINLIDLIPVLLLLLILTLILGKKEAG